MLKNFPKSLSEQVWIKKRNKLESIHARNLAFPPQFLALLKIDPLVIIFEKNIIFNQFIYFRLFPIFYFLSMCLIIYFSNFLRNFILNGRRRRNWICYLHSKSTCYQFQTNSLILYFLKCMKNYWNFCL